MKQNSYFHQDNMSVKCIPHFYTAKNEVCRGIPIFLIFDPKHGLWVLVREILILAASDFHDKMKLVS